MVRSLFHDCGAFSYFFHIVDVAVFFSYLYFDLRAGPAAVGYCGVTRAGARGPGQSTVGQHRRGSGALKIRLFRFGP